MSKTESLKQRYKETVWTNYVQVFTDINYSSLYCEQLREKQRAIYFWGIYICMGLPTILSVLLKMGYISSEILVYIACILLLIVPVVLKFKNKKLIYVVLGLYEREIAELLKLNEDLEKYKGRLLDLFFKLEALSDKTTSIEKIIQSYEILKNDNVRYLTLHDNLTSKIDPELQKKAQDMTDTMIKNSNYHESK